jgi:hypothetical protein
MQALVLNRFVRDPGLIAEFDLRNPAAPGWAKAKVPIDDAELAQLVKDGAAHFAPVELEPRSYSHKLVQPPGTQAGVAEEARRVHFVGPVDFEIELAGGRHLETEVTIERNAFVAAEHVSVRTQDGTTVYEERLPADGKGHVIDLKVPAGRYVLHVEDQKATFTVRAPPGTPFVARTLTSTDLSPRVYFWVPRGLRQIALYVPAGSGPFQLFDADGRHVEAASAGLILATVPAGQDGRAWSFASYKSFEPIRMLNLPQAFAASPAALLVPEDAVSSP